MARRVSAMFIKGIPGAKKSSILLNQKDMPVFMGGDPQTSETGGNTS
jgi:hypothetical protein